MALSVELALCDSGARPPASGRRLSASISLFHSRRSAAAAATSAPVILESLQVSVVGRTVFHSSWARLPSELQGSRQPPLFASEPVEVLADGGAPASLDPDDVHTVWFHAVLPRGLPPSFSGTAVKHTYALVVVAQLRDGGRQTAQLPFRVTSAPEQWRRCTAATGGGAAHVDGSLSWVPGAAAGRAKRAWVSAPLVVAGTEGGGGSAPCCWELSVQRGGGGRDEGAGWLAGALRRARHWQPPQPPDGGGGGNGAEMAAGLGHEAQWLLPRVLACAPAKVPPIAMLRPPPLASRSDCLGIPAVFVLVSLAPGH